MSDTVLVTGASGYVGQHCVVELLKQGFQVRGSLRDLSRSDEVRQGVAKMVDPGDNLEFCKLDLMDDEGWDAAMKGCKFVLHVASPYIIAQPKDEDELIKPAREGTLRALTAAKKAGVKRVVLTSSIVAMAAHLKTGLFDHTSWTDLDHAALNAYAKSKTIAEQAAWEFINNQEGADPMEMATINPGAVLGPTLTNDLGGASMSMVKDMLTGKMPMLPKMGIVMVDVRDVAQLHVRAMTEKGAAGKRFIAADAPAHGFDDVAKILKANGYPNISTRIAPDLLLRFIGLFDRNVKGMVALLGRRVDCDYSQTRDVLKWTPMPLETTVLDTAKSVSAALEESAS